MGPLMGYPFPMPFGEGLSQLLVCGIYAKEYTRDCLVILSKQRRRPMRIISGTARGRRLLSIPGMNTRPTTDRVKEALFNIISPQVPNCDFLDLFAGNGGIGIEALSRGANLAVFIEKNPKCTQIIKENLKNAKLTGEVYTRDVFSAIEIMGKKRRVFDLIFLDPPYAKGLVSKALLEFAKADILKPSGMVVAEYGRKEEIPSHVWKLHQVREERYGDTVLGFYKLEEENK